MEKVSGGNDKYEIIVNPAGGPGTGSFKYGVYVNGEPSKELSSDFLKIAQRNIKKEIKNKQQMRTIETWRG